MDICLTMIVRNEAKIIRRCLRSAKPFITSWAICDTGSTDDTVKVILDELKDIPGFLTHHQWSNFSFNRTESFNCARTISKQKGYALLLDADHEITGTVPELSADSYMITQQSASSHYPNVRLIKTSQSWKCIGVTHEYWSGPGNQEYLDSLIIIDHEDGGTRPEKLKRDEILLRQGLIDEPRNARYFFYLAQTVEGSNPREAIELYKERSNMGGFAEEAWMAHYRAARLLLNSDKAVGQLELQKTWEKAPHRAEPLYWLAKYHREQGDNWLAMLYAEKAKQIPMPKNALFVELCAYNWGPDEEISIAGFYTERTKGLAACERCIEYPESYELAHRNIVHYAERLFRADSGRIEVPKLEGYTPGTPSICDDIISVRMLNYDQKYGREFVPRDGTGIFKTKTQICKNGKWNVVDDSITDKWNGNSHITGLEDWRLFKYRGHIWFVANCCMVPDRQGGPQVVIGRLSNDLRTVVELITPKYGNWCEKNWQPIYNTATLVYSYDPFVIITHDGTEIKKLPGKNLPRWRGSAPPVKINEDCYVGIVHDVIYNSGTEDNVYLHRFVAFNVSGIIAVSSPFIFEHKGIEYTAGMQLEGDMIKIVYSVKEYATHWLTIPVSIVLNMLGLA